MKAFTTLNQIRQHSTCSSRLAKLLTGLRKTSPDDEPLSLERILEINGVADAIWAIRAVEGHEKPARLFACDCAESVLHMFEGRHPDDKRPRTAIEVSRRFANGDATTEELRSARSAAYAAVCAVALNDSADLAAYAAYVACDADSADSASAASYADAACADIETRTELFKKHFCTE